MKYKLNLDMLGTNVIDHKCRVLWAGQKTVRKDIVCKKDGTQDILE